MAIQVGGTTVVNDSRQLQNISSIDSITNTAISNAGFSSLTTGSGTAQIGTLKIAWGKTPISPGSTAYQTLPFSYTSTSSFGVVAISDDGNATGATRAAQGVTIAGVNQILLAKAGFTGNYMHWVTVGY